jgi:hypothetical protein
MHTASLVIGWLWRGNRIEIGGDSRGKGPQSLYASGRYVCRSSSGSFAIFAAIRRALMAKIGRAATLMGNRVSVSLPATSRAAHAERKASLTLVGIHRDRPPMNSIAARRQRFEANAYHVAIDLRLALIDACPAGIRYVSRTKCRLQCVRKCQRDLMRGLRNRTIGPRTGVVKRGVGQCRARACQRNDASEGDPCRRLGDFLNRPTPYV